MRAVRGLMLRQAQHEEPMFQALTPQGAHLRCLGAIPSLARDRKGLAVPDGEGLIAALG